MMTQRFARLALIAVGLAACSPSSPEPRQRESDVSPASFAEVMQQTLYDYEPVETPALLAGEADLVVTGTIGAVRAGQSYAPSDSVRPQVATSVLEIRVDEVVQGDPDLTSDGSVYIEIAHPAFVGEGADESNAEEVPFDLEAFAKTIPVDAHGVWFLMDRTTEPYLDAIVNEGAGRPASASITGTFIQGFLLDDPKEGLVSINEPLELMPPAWQELDSVAEVLDAIRAGVPAPSPPAT